ncbi:MAG: hypothetical protein ABIG61_06525 [Planctomycetota bacterium]
MNGNLTCRLLLRVPSFKREFENRSPIRFVSVDHNVFATHVRCEMDITKGKPFRRMTFGMDVFLDIKPTDPNATVQTGFEDGVAWQTKPGEKYIIGW